MTSLRVGVGHHSATTDTEQNTAVAVGLVAQAAAAGARLLVLPEYAVAWAPRLHPGLAAGHPAFVAALRRAAHEHAVHVVAGTLVPTEDKVANVAVVIGPDGRDRGAYTKVHLFDAFGVTESDVLTPGEPGHPVVVDVDGWAIGLATCYDLRFPEIFRELIDAGADAFAVGAAWADGPGKADQLDVLSRARALENTSYLMLACQSGHGRCGASRVIDPLGVPVVPHTDAGSLVVADLHRSRLDEVRAMVPSLRHRRYAVEPARPASVPGRGGQTP